MKFVDTHAHMCDASFDKDLEDVLKRAATSGCCAIISVSEDLEDAQKTLKLAKEHQILLPGAGLFPTNLDIKQAEEMYRFIESNKKQLVAIGEVGLDYWKVKEEELRQVQRHIFRGFIELANRLNLVLNVHSRSAGRHVISMLLENNAQKVQLHSFDAKAATAMKGAEAGWFFSIPPSIVRSRQKQKLVKKLPLTSLMVESDSPVLGPDPRKRNEPANCVVALRAIADIKRISLEEVADRLLENSRRLYGNVPVC